MEVITKSSIDLKAIDADFQKFILNEDHPCIMAKSLFKMHNYDLHAFENMYNPSDLRDLISKLKSYLANYDQNTTQFQSFVAVFPNNHFSEEIDFEESLWETLQTLHEIDETPWDKSVSRDPDDPKFSFSLLGEAFYIIGLHPNSSRIARQAPYTTLVFNLHSQFEKLREIGSYHNVRDTIRQNDEKLQGSINPVLRDFGDSSESRQYSGRKVEDDWKCPFHHKHS